MRARLWAVVAAFSAGRATSLLCPAFASLTMALAAGYESLRRGFFGQ